MTSPLRAPFTRYTGVSGPAELAEEVRHPGGLRRAVGILVAPKPTRVVASVFAAVAVSDFLQFAYAATEQAVE